MELVAFGLPLVMGGVWLKYQPSRAHWWYRLAAWASANGDAAVERSRRRVEYMAEADERAGVKKGGA